MRTLTAEAFHDTVNYCFMKTLDSMGSSVREVVYDRLRSHNVREDEIGVKLDDVYQVLMDSFGGSARVILYKMMVELYGQYQIRADFTYQDGLKDYFLVLQNRVFSDHLLPRKVRGEEQDAFHAYRTIVQASRIEK
jgi:hypothetical protein